MKNSKKTKILAGAAVLCLIAIGVIVLMLNSDGRRLNSQLQLGQKYLEEMDYEQAVVAFNEVIAIDPVNVDAYLGLADAYFRLGEYENSLVCIDRLLELDSGNAQIKPILTDCLNEYIKILEEEERYDEIKALAEKYGNMADGVDFKSAFAKMPIKVDVLKTDIEADSVSNAEGYGCLRIDGVGNSWDFFYYGEAADAGVIPPQKAVADREGNFIFPYKSTYLSYYISDGIVSLTDSSAYGISEIYDVMGNPPQYYHLDGSSIFELAPVTGGHGNDALQGLDSEGISENSNWYAAPMRDGYALAINTNHWRWRCGGGTGEYPEVFDYANYTDYTVDQETVQHVSAEAYETEHHSYIIDRDGAIACTLPEEFNEEVVLGDGGFGTKYELGSCGEGWFAVFEQGNDENGDYFYRPKEYMDSAGNMALDLSGSGFTYVWFFHEGLAAVRSEDDMIGFIDKRGELVIPCIYESANLSFSEDGICAVQKDGKWGYIDRDNNIVIPFEYDDAYGADAGLASVIKGEKCGLVDYQNRIVTDFEYDDISSPDEGVVYAIKDRILYIITVNAQ